MHTLSQTHTTLWVCYKNRSFFAVKWTLHPHLHLLLPLLLFPCRCLSASFPPLWFHLFPGRCHSQVVKRLVGSMFCKMVTWRFATPVQKYEIANAIYDSCLPYITAHPCAEVPTSTLAAFNPFPFCFRGCYCFIYHFWFLMSRQQIIFQSLLAIIDNLLFQTCQACLLFCIRPITNG